MGFVSLATAQFDAMSAFYCGTLGGTVLKSWDRDNARGMLLDLGGLRLERPALAPPIPAEPCRPDFR